MTRFKFITYLMPLAIAGALALGLAAAPAMAHCRGQHLDGDECIHEDKGQRSQTFMVELIDPVPLGAITTGSCIGSSQRKQVTDAKFPPSTVSGCEGLTLEGDSQSFHLCQVNINRPDRPDMNMTFFFTTGVGVVGAALCTQDVYVGHFPAAFDEEICAGEEEGATCVTIDLSGLTLEKLNQPDKGTPAAGVVLSVGTAVWTPVQE